MKEQIFCYWTTLGKRSSYMNLTFFMCFFTATVPAKIMLACQNEDISRRTITTDHGVMSEIVSWAYSKHLKPFTIIWALLTNCQAALRYHNTMCPKQLTGQPWITCTVDLQRLFDQVTGLRILKGRVFCSTFNTFFKKFILNIQYLALWQIHNT